jgi:hypothetical protein
MTTCPFTDVAKEIADEASTQLVLPLTVVGFWHSDLAGIALRVDEGRTLKKGQGAALCGYLRAIAWWASALLANLGVEDPAAAFVAEWERAAVKHPGMTLDCDGPTDENRFYALAEEAGEVAASLTYDNAQDTGHNADLISEVTQVGALALAWLTRYQDGGER